MVISRLLDTNTVAELAKNVPNESVIEQIKRHDQELAIASVVWHELLYGWYRMPDGKKKMLIGDFIKQVVSVLPIIDYDAKAGRIHAELRASLESKGRPLPFADGQIASIREII